MDAQTQGFVDGCKLAIGNAAKAVYDAEAKSPEEQEFLVQALLDLLLKHGHLNRREAGEAWYEEQSREFDSFVDLFHGGIGSPVICTRVYFDGRVEHQEC